MPSKTRPSTIRPPSPYLEPGFYDRALEQGRHREIVGGRWDETGRVQMEALIAAGMRPHHRLLDIGAGSLRLGCKAVDYLDPGHYWATDASRALMLRGHDCELSDRSRLPVAQLIEDAEFAFPGLQGIHFDFAIAFGVFTHLPLSVLARALISVGQNLAGRPHLLFTVFLAPAMATDTAFRQPDGVVTHRDRPPYHFTDDDVITAAGQAGFDLHRSDQMLPRGQVLFIAQPARS